MIKRKKITRMSLAELAKEMPVVHEYDMSLMLGGVKYYDLTGNYLGSRGSSDEARFILRDEFSSLSSNLSESDAPQKGSTWNGLNGINKCDVVRGLIGGFSNLSNLGGVGLDLKDRVMGVDQVRYSDGTYGQVYFSVSDNGSISTFEDLISILTHENIHAELRTISGKTGVMNSSESDAYSGQVANPSFKNCSYNFRAQTARYWFASQERKNYTEEQIAQLCGVSVYDVY